MSEEIRPKAPQTHFIHGKHEDVSKCQVPCSRLKMPPDVRPSVGFIVSAGCDRGCMWARVEEGIDLFRTSYRR